MRALPTPLSVAVNGHCVKKKVQNIMFSVSLEELKLSMNNIFVMCDICLQARENHFQHLL
jgi:hypothetical protein